MASQEAPQILLLPLLCRSVVLEASLALAKCAGVIVTAAVFDHGGHRVMQHLMKDDRLDEKPGNPRLIQHWVDPNQPFLGQIGTQLKRPLPTFWTNLLSPSDTDVRPTSEMTPGQILHDGNQVVMRALGCELALRWS